MGGGGDSWQILGAELQSEERRANMERLGRGHGCAWRIAQSEARDAAIIRWRTRITESERKFLDRTLLMRKHAAVSGLQPIVESLRKRR